ncbi:hypothetical protein SKB0092_38490 (plasmid) [Roseomonas mucosa]
MKPGLARAGPGVIPDPVERARGMTAPGHMPSEPWPAPKDTPSLRGDGCRALQSGSAVRLPLLWQSAAVTPASEVERNIVDASAARKDPHHGGGDIATSSPGDVLFPIKRERGPAAALPHGRNACRYWRPWCRFPGAGPADRPGLVPRFGWCRRFLPGPLP